MNIVVFGLSITSAWGNGHATLLRGLFRVLNSNGHNIEFFEWDTPYYASHRDGHNLPYVRTHLYSSWDDTLLEIRRTLDGADAAIVTSYCPNGAEACALIVDTPHLRRIFYDMDTPVTLSQLNQGNVPPYLPPDGLAEFDLVLSYTGGGAISELRDRLGAKNVASLYGWVDPETYLQVPVRPDYEADLSYLGTYAADRQLSLEELFIEPARQSSDGRFIIAGAMYPEKDNWPQNIRYLDHVAPPDHAAFYSSATLTLNVTRGAMAAMGYCPSGRLFEAAACGTPVLSDWWEGLDSFFVPNEEILITRSTPDSIKALRQDRAGLARVGARARERTLDCHTAAARAKRLMQLIEDPQGASKEEDVDVYEGAR